MDKASIAYASNAFRIAIVVAVLMLALTVYGLLTGVNVFALSAWIVLALICALAAVLARRGRSDLGVGLMLAVALVFFPFSSINAQGAGVLMGTIALILASVLAYTALSPRWRVWAMGAAIVSAVATILLDIFGPPTRIVPLNFDATIVISVLVLALYAVFLLRNFGSFSLRAKMIVVTLALTLIPLTILTVLNTQASADATVNQTRASLEGMAQTQAQTVEGLLVNETDQLRVLSLNTELSQRVTEVSSSYSSDAAKVKAEMDQNEATWRSAVAANDDSVALVAATLKNPVAYDLNSFSYIYPLNVQLLLTDRYGGLVAATARPQGYYQGDAAWWQAAYNGGKGAIYLGQPLTDGNGNTYAMDVAVPVYDPLGQTVRGVLHSTYSLQGVKAQLESIKPGQTGHIHILLPDNKTIGYEQFGSHDPATLQQLRAATSDFVQVAAPKVATRYYSLAPVKISGTTSTIQAVGDLNWIVLVHQNVVEALAPVEAQTRNAVILALLIAALAGALAIGGAELLTTPIRRLTTVAEKVRSGDLAARAAVDSTDEIGTLARTFNSMTGQLGTLVGQLEQRVTDRTAQLELNNAYYLSLQDISLALLKRRDLASLLQDIIERAGELVGTKNGYVFMFDPETNEMIMRVGVGAYQEFVGTKAEPGVALAGKVWQTGEAIVVDDYRNWSGRLADPSRNVLRAVVGVPLKSQDQVVGVIGLAHLEPEKRFGPTEMDVLNRFAALASLALDNTQLLEASQRELEQRRSVEQALAYERDLLKALMDNMPEMIFFKDRGSHFVRSNQAHLQNLHAASMDEVYGKTDLDIFESDAAREYMANEARIIETGMSMLNQREAPIRQPDGSFIYFESTKVPWRDANGATIGTLAIARNVTDRVLTEQKLEEELAQRREAERKLAYERDLLQAIMDTLPDLIFFKDRESRFVRSNAAHLKNLDAASMDEVFGKTDLDFHVDTPAHGFMDDERHVLETGAPILNKIESNPAKDGTVRYFSTSKVPWRDAEGNIIGTLGVAHNITELVLAERKLQGEVTERLRVEQEIRASREFLETLIENVPLGIFVKDGTTHQIVQWNKANEAITGIRATEVLGKTDHDFFPKEEADFFLAKDQETFERGVMLDIPTEELETPDHHVRILHTKKIPLFDASGKPAFLLGISDDITEQRRAEEQLRESERMLSKAQEIAHVGSWRWDTTSGSVEWSNELYRILGLPRQGMPPRLDQFLQGMVSVEEQGHVGELKQAITQDELPQPIELHVVMPGGVTRFLYTESEHIYNEQGEPNGLIGIVQDVTERRHAEEQLRESEERYRDLFENANDWIQSVNADGQFLYVNQAWKDALGYTDQDVVNLRFIDIVHPDWRGEYVAMSKRLIAGEKVLDLRAEVQTKSGQKLIAEGNVTPRIVNGTVVSTRGIFRDVTARLQVEERATYQNALLTAQFQVSPDGIFVVGSDDSVLSYNDRFIEMWNLRSEDMHEGTAEALRRVVLEQLIDPEEWLGRSGEIYMRQHQSSHDEVEFKDGRIFERYSAPINTSDGTYLGRVWFFHDVTESRRAQQEIIRVTQNAHAIFWRASVYKLDDAQAEAEGFHWDTQYANPETVLNFLPIPIRPGQDFGAAWYASWLDEDKRLMDHRSSQALREHRDGYSQEFRLRVANGNVHSMFEDARVRWVDEKRAEVTGFTVDITERKREQEALLSLAEATSTAVGERFFEGLTQSLATTLGVKHAFVARLNEDASRVRTLAFWKFGESARNIEYALDGTPCKQVIGGAVSMYPNDVQTLFPTDRDLVDMQAQSYLGIPLYSSVGEVLGHLAVLDTEPMRDEGRRRAIMQIFAARAGAEMERQINQEELQYERYLLTTLMDNLPHNIYFKDAQSRFIRANLAMARYHGFTDPAVTVGKTDFDLFTEEHARPAYEDEQEIIRTGKPILDKEEKETFPGGRVEWTTTTKMPLYNPSGDVAGTFGISFNITERKLAEEQVQKQNAYLNALQETSLGLMQRLDVTSLLEDIVARAGALVGTESGYVFLRDPDVEEMELRVGVGAYEGFVGRRTQRGVGLAGQVWESNAPVVVDDYRMFGARLADPSRDILRAVMGVPLRSGNEVIGVIGLAYLDEARPFGEAEIQVLQRFAQLAAIALDNARLYETAQQELIERSRIEAELERQLHETELLNRVTNHAVSLDVDKALVQICRDMAEYFQVDQSGIALLSEDRQTLTVVADYSPTQAGSFVGHVIPVQGNPSTEIVLETRKPAAFADAQTDPRLAAVQDLMLERGTASILIAPLFVRDEIIGTIGIDAYTRREFSPEDIALVERAATSISTALENARLYLAAQQELAERTRAEQETRQRNKELEVISRVSAVMTTNIDMKTALETLARELVQTFQARNCGIALLNPDKQSLTVVADALMEGHEEHAVGIIIPVENNPSTQYVLKHRHSLVIADAQTDPMTEPIHERMIQRHTKCLAIIPLLSAGEVIGTIGLDTTDPDHIFSDEEIRLAETMANQMANAIEKQRLFDQAKARARREQLTREIGSNLSRTLDRERILQTMARELSHALGASHAVVRVGATEKKEDGENGHS